MLTADCWVHCSGPRDGDPGPAGLQPPDPGSECGRSGRVLRHRPPPRPPHNQQQSRGRQWSCDHDRQGTSSSVQVTVVLTVELQTNFCEDFTIMEKAKATSRDGKGWTALRIYANQNRPSLMTIVLASQFLFTAC